MGKLKLKISGMTCSSCEVLIENEFSKISGVEKVFVHQGSGKADVYCSGEPRLDQFQKAVEPHGYQVAYCGELAHSMPTVHQNTKDDYLQIGSIFLFLVTLYLFLKQMQLIPQGLSISENMSLGFIFLIGLVAAVSSCIAVVGGVLLAASAKYSEMNPHLTGLQKFKPHIYFNLGRIVSYTVLGGVVGLLGSTLTLSSRVNGVLILLVSIVMILLGFQLLKLFPSLGRFQPKMPKFIARFLYARLWRVMAEGKSKSTPFVLGGFTFFLPCGFTQALQLYVLTQGDWLTGALTMLMFSLGTLPALLSLSTVTSFAKGEGQKFLLKFAGVMVILIGTFNINNGLVLTGIRIGQAAAIQDESKTEVVVQETVTSETSLQSVEIVDGKQIVEMAIEGFSYSPSEFTVQVGIPVEWRVDGSGARGCASSLIMSKLNIAEYLSPTKITLVSFIPEEVGTLSFNCSMGMMTPGRFNVVENTSGIVPTPVAESEVIESEEKSSPEITNGEVQSLFMEVSNEKGFYPNTFTVKKDIPVELTMDVKVDLGGCMEVLAIPDYEFAQILNIGTNVVRFTPTEAGIVDAMCPMGILMVTFIVED